MDIYIVIPAYKPDKKLSDLLSELTQCFPVIVVDDGSGEGYADIFEQAKKNGVHLLHHETNQGKGAAIKTGIRYARDIENCSGIVTADADGQHSPRDISRIADKMQAAPDTFILGERSFSGMPFRSRFGNSFSKLFFRLATGLKISDTQTGLRGIPRCLFDNLLSLEGNRYEYEMDVLLSLKQWKAQYASVDISTIYIDNNSSSHFHPVRDGLRVFGRIIKYILASVFTTLLDFAIFTALFYLFLKGTPYAEAVSYAIARVISATVNYQLNLRMVFKANGSYKTALGYILLAVCSLCLGSVTVKLLSAIVNPVIAKLCIDTALFIFNYLMQKHVIFKQRAK